MDKYLSDKLKAISFFSMVMIVYLHAQNLEIKMSTDTEIIRQGYNSVIQAFISQGISKNCRYHYFSIISGYLFFYNIKGGYIREFLSKYKKRLNTLVVPYLVWSIYGILFYLIAQSISPLKPFFTKELITDYSVSDLLSRIFIHPIPYQLWFVRDLVVLVLLSPIIYWSIKYLKYFFVLFFFIAWLSSFNFHILSSKGLLFFITGAYLGINGISLQNLTLKNSYWILTICWILVILCKTGLSYIGFENIRLLGFLLNISILLGIPAIWSMYDHLLKDRDISTTRFYALFQYTFFLYAFHEPTLTILKKILYYILGTTELSSFIIYIFAPFFTIIIAILAGTYLKRFLPRFYNVISGKR